MHDFAASLATLARADLKRTRRTVEGPQGPRLTVDGREYLGFASNDYLGLANHPALVEAARAAALRCGVGGGASHLICGHHSAHEALEDALARFVGMPRALYFSTGYMAATGAIPALVRRGDAIFADELNHACLIDGARLARAETYSYPHSDTAALACLLEQSQAKNKLIVSDCVFSMDGDLAPLPELLRLAETHDALLFVDDAHGFGVLGDGGRGSLAHFGLVSPRIVYMGTLGKAAGVFGAFVAGAADVIEWLMQRARTYIFTTAAPPLLAETLLTSLDVIAKEAWRRDHLRALIARLRAGLEGLPWRLLASDTPIQPLIVGGNEAVVTLSERLRERGLWVPAIRPPTVPMGSARLRISLSAAHTLDDVVTLCAALRSVTSSVEQAV